MSMVLNIKVLLAFLCVGFMGVLFQSCTPKFTLTGTSINYDLIKSIQIDKIANRAPYGWAPMEAILNNKLQDRYANQTRLKLVKKGGDLHLSGEIISYDQFNKSVSANGYSAQVQLKLTVNIRYNSPKQNINWEKQFTAQTQYDSNQQLAAVQEKLVTEMINNLTDQIFNATVADW